MQSASPDFGQLKSNLKASWMAGDFGQIANYAVKAGEDFHNVWCSRPVTKPPARAAGIALFPVPHATSRTRAPGLISVRATEHNVEFLSFVRKLFSIALVETYFQLFCVGSLSRLLK